MGGSSFSFIRALNKYIENKLRAFVLIDGTVTAVNDNFTVNILINEVAFSGVPVKVLTGSQASIYEVPVIGSACLVRFIDGHRGLPSIDSFDKVDKYYINPVTELFISAPKTVFNNGNNGGLVLVTPLSTEINNIITNVNLINTKLNALAPTPVIPPLDPLDPNSIQNQIITQ